MTTDRITTRKDKDTGEYLIEHRIDGKIDEAKTYYTDDREDLAGTLKAETAWALKTFGENNVTVHRRPGA